MSRAALWLGLVAVVVGLVAAALYVRDATAEGVEALDRELEAVVRDNDELARALDKARRRHPDAAVVAVTRSSTGPVVAHGAPRPDNRAGTDGGGAGLPLPGGHGGAGDGLARTQAPGSIPGPAPSCLLAVGDAVELRVDTVALGKAGRSTLELVGSASAWRLTPGPAAELARGTFEATLPAPRARWGFGAGLLGSAQGPAPALAVAAPPAVFFGWSVEATVAVGWGAGGPQAAALLLARP